MMMDLVEYVENLSYRQLLKLRQIVEYEIVKYSEIEYFELEMLNLSTRTKNVLISANINSVGELSKFTLLEIKAMKNVGPRTIFELSELLKKHKLYWRFDARNSEGKVERKIVMYVGGLNSVNLTINQTYEVLDETKSNKVKIVDDLGLEGYYYLRFFVKEEKDIY